MSRRRIPIKTAIPDITTPWDNGVSAYTGKMIENFIKQQISEIISSKFGDARYEDGGIAFYSEDGGARIGFVDLSNGVSYTIDTGIEHTSSFYVLTSEKRTPVTLAPTTKEGVFGSSEKTDYDEDYSFQMFVDDGTGYTDRTPSQNMIRGGESMTVDIRPWLKNGINKIRFIVTGDLTGQVKSTVLTVNLTALNIVCNHTWHKAWIEGEDYSINNIFFGGNLAKTLHVKIDDAEYTQTFSAATQYTSVPYEFSVTDKFPATGTGVHNVEIWMEGADVRTQSYKFRVMCVSEHETATAKLICINSVPENVVNYTTVPLFEYATYNLTEVDVDITAVDNGNTQPMITGQRLSQQTQTKQQYTTSVIVVSDEISGLSLEVALSGDEALEEAEIQVDNTKAYVATPGAVFYLNPALRANNRADKYEIHNTAPGAADSTYSAEWTDFTFQDDAWSADPDGNKALAVMAGSYLEVPELYPLSASGTQSQTVEFMFRASNIADYDKPIFSVMSTDEYDPETTRGIILFPTRLQVLTSHERSMIFQKIDLAEDRNIHVAVVIQRNFITKTGVRNICRIFINGRENVTFEFSGPSSFINETVSHLRIGQESTDTYLYMMRVYDRALEGGDIVNNYINALIESADMSKAGEKADNSILDSGIMDYHLTKRAGFNILLLETEDNMELPSLNNPNTEGQRITLKYEYNDHPEWNVNIRNIPWEGQGTTSFMYYMWNIRHRITDENTEWEYPNLRDERGNVLIERGKDGYIAGYGLHPKVSKITHKKNVASSPHGHKMGATALYNDLFVACEGTDMLPNPNCRVATYQNPFIGFQKFANGTYKFIGLYTSGPDKTDKKTFGYNETTLFPNLMMLEGPNHAPYMTRFLVPWTDDVFYDYPNETLSTGDSNMKQEGWDADIAADYKTDKATDQANVMGLYNSEFKPAYDAIYYTSPYIETLSATGKTLDEINANVTSFQSQKTNGVRNDLLTFYDSQYRLVYFRYKTQRYEVLPLEIHNMLDYLELTGTPTTEDIKSARAAKFTTEVFQYVSKQEALFHEAFCELVGLSDNHAKNTYWRKFRSIADGGKWGYNEDDMDTIFETDNNGQDTKDPYVEPGDLNPASGAEIFQGSNSAFWTQLRNCCKNELRDKMLLITSKMVEMAARYNCSASTVHRSVLNVIDHYFWSKSAKYFPAMAYNEDTLFAYINVWASAPDASYNSVRPLTQIHGDHYETERAWMERRIAYIFSKYRIGGFRAQDGDGYGTLEFTPAESFDMVVTPAIDLYPRFSIGGAETSTSDRTTAGDDCTLHLPGSSDTTLYVKGVDWLSDIGDLHNLKLASRGGSEEINFTVSGKRLRNVVIGSEDEQVDFNATTIGISGPSIEEIHAENASSVRGSLELFDCTRLKKAYFNGTNLSQIMFPIGGRLNEIKMPSTLTTLFLHSLNLLDNEGLQLPDEAYANIENLYINKCEGLQPAAILFRIISSQNNNLRFATLYWEGTFTLQHNDQLERLLEFVNHLYDTQSGTGVGALDFENGQLITLGRTPDIQGAIFIPFAAYQESIDEIQRLLPTLKIQYDPTRLAIKFADPEVRRIMVANFDKNNDSVVEVGEISNTTLLSSIFQNNSIIETFNELKYIPLTTIVQRSYYQCSNLRSISLPDTVDSVGSNAFYGCRNLSEIFIPDRPIYYQSTAFQNTAANKSVHITNLSSFLQSKFSYDQTSSPLCNNGELYINGQKQTTIVVPEDITTIPSYGLMQANIESVILPEGIEIIDEKAFYYNTNIQAINIPNSTRKIGDYAFSNCTNLVIPSINANLEYIGNHAFSYTKDLPSISSTSVKFLGTQAFFSCTQLSSVSLSGTFENQTSFAHTCRSIGNSTEGGSITIIATSTMNISSFFEMFYSCTKIQTITISISNSGNATLAEMFINCNKLSSLNIDNFEPGNIISLPSAFSGCIALPSINLSGWDVSACTNFQSCFYLCRNLTTLNLGNWDMGSATNLKQMFYDCHSLENLTLPSVDIPNLTSDALHSTFYNCRKLTSLDLSRWNTSNCTSFSNLFKQCCSLSSLNISNWDVSKVTNFSECFSGCESLTTLDLSGWQANPVNIYGMFYTMPKLEFLDVSNFNNINCSGGSVFGAPKLRFIRLGSGWFARGCNGGVCGFSNLNSLGVDENNDDNGWLSHLQGVLALATPATGADKTIYLHSNLKNATWAQPYLTQIAALGWTIA